MNPLLETVVEYNGQKMTLKTCTELVNDTLIYGMNFTEYDPINKLWIRVDPTKVRI